MKKNGMPSHHGQKIEPENRDYPNETIRLLNIRASCRNFKISKIPASLQTELFEAGRHAATGGNLQPFSVIKIEDEVMRKKLAEMCYQRFMAKAPLHLLFCLDWHRLGRWAELELAPFTAPSSFRHFWISFQDTLICAQSVCTAADALGLGSVYIGTIMEYMSQVRHMFKLPPQVLPVVLLCLGYPKSELKVRKKLPGSILFHDEMYHDLDDDQIRQTFQEKYSDIRISLTPDRLKTLEEVATSCHGHDFAQRCLEKVKGQGFINAIQRYFGLHYRADFMNAHNHELLQEMEKAGFTWFKPGPDRR